MSTCDGRASSVPARIRLLVLDVDGVLTDGRLFIAPRARSSRSSTCATAPASWRCSAPASTVAIISGRDSAAVTRRAAELGIRHVSQGVADKGRALEELLRDLGLTAAQAACVGDDTPDMPMLEMRRSRRRGGRRAPGAHGRGPLDHQLRRAAMARCAKYAICC